MKITNDVPDDRLAKTKSYQRKDRLDHKFRNINTPSPEDFEAFLTNPDHMVRSYWIKRNLSMTGAQIDRALDDAFTGVRGPVAARTDYVATLAQQEKGLADESWPIRQAWVKRMDNPISDAQALRVLDDKNVHVTRSWLRRTDLVFSEQVQDAAFNHVDPVVQELLIEYPGLEMRLKDMEPIIHSAYLDKQNRMSAIIQKDLIIKAMDRHYFSFTDICNERMAYIFDEAILDSFKRKQAALGAFDVYKISNPEDAASTGRKMRL